MNFDSSFGQRIAPLLSWARYVSWAELSHRLHKERLATHATANTLDLASVQEDNWPL
jgi:hypothetical protein